MREVTRNGTRTLVIWALFDGVTWQEWIQLEDPEIRTAKLLADRAVEVDPRHMQDGQLLAEHWDTYRPSIPSRSPKGAAWYPVGSMEALAYNTPTKELEVGDVCFDGTDVRWEDGEGPRNERGVDVIVSRDGTNKVTQVRKR